jgi:phage shock protein C
MTLGEELSQIEELHKRGSLNDDEFSRAKARLLGSVQLPARGSPAASINGFRRTLTDRWIGGVCGGLGRLSGVESWIWRLLFVVFSMAGGAGLLIYALLWIFVPLEAAA